uniref:Uncharacterized protein n=1 Tax=Anguilla anguilla TaxID=7936 RepID=A0A0E9VF42_ANGAN
MRIVTRELYPILENDFGLPNLAYHCMNEITCIFQNVN